MSNLRVIAGKAKKRRLKSPGKLPVRPTADRVKEALFNILGDLVPGSYFADLYAGTGAVGIEALSRGAKKVLFVERDPRVARLLGENLALAGLTGDAQILRADVQSVLPGLVEAGENIDIIFADPPYRQGQALKTLNILAMYPVWHKNALVVLETDAGEDLPGRAGVFTLWRRQKYGDTALYFYRPVCEED